jgi:NADH-ubiquinone oxidoreductase chain 3
MNNLLILFIFIPVLTFILLLLNLLLAPQIPDESKVSPYECGFLNIPGQTRSIFHVHFYIVALLFLIFDLEILLIMPVAVSLYQISIYGFSIALIFFLVLTIGFILEIGSGAIYLQNKEN